MNINITDRAWKRIEFALSKNDKAVKLSIITGGCAGTKYHFSLVNKIQDEYIFRKENLTLIIDKNSAKQLNNITLDFETRLIGSSFTITNPNIDKSCRCGVSFSAN